MLCDRVHKSHDHSVLQGIGIARRNLMLITLRAERVNVQVMARERKTWGFFEGAVEGKDWLD